MKGGEGAQLLLLTIITHNAASEGRLSVEWAHTPVALRCIRERCVDALSVCVGQEHTYYRIFKREQSMDTHI